MVFLFYNNVFAQKDLCLFYLLNYITTGSEFLVYKLVNYSAEPLIKYTGTGICNLINLKILLSIISREASFYRFYGFFYFRGIKMEKILINRRRNCLVSTVAAVLFATLILSFTIASSGSMNYQDIGVLGSNAENLQQQEQTQNQPQNSGTNLTDYESAILNLINTVRADRGLAALQPNQSLTDISRTRSNDMLSRDYFSHYTPEGKNVFNIFRECGITFRAAGENLAHSRPADIGTPDAFLNAWMNSPTHAANILQSKYGIIGVGMVENGGRRVVTTVFRNS